MVGAGEACGAGDGIGAGEDSEEEMEGEQDAKPSPPRTATLPEDRESEGLALLAELMSAHGASLWREEPARVMARGERSAESAASGRWSTAVCAGAAGS